jgi:hypothetical protein
VVTEPEGAATVPAHGRKLAPGCDGAAIGAEGATGARSARSAEATGDEPEPEGGAAVPAHGRKLAPIRTGAEPEPEPEGAAVRTGDEPEPGGTSGAEGAAPKTAGASDRDPTSPTEGGAASRAHVRTYNRARVQVPIAYNRTKGAETAPCNRRAERAPEPTEPTGAGAGVAGTPEPEQVGLGQGDGRATERTSSAGGAELQVLEPRPGGAGKSRTTSEPRRVQMQLSDLRISGEAHELRQLSTELPPAVQPSRDGKTIAVAFEVKYGNRPGTTRLVMLRQTSIPGVYKVATVMHLECDDPAPFQSRRGHAAI